MLTTLALALLSVAHAGAPEADPSASWIVNGKAISTDQFPSAVAIGFDARGIGRQATCSASFITPRLLLTAAHCTNEFEKQGLNAELINQFAVAFLTDDVNAAGGETIGFAKFTNHPSYTGSDQRIRNDIGIVELEEDADVETIWIASEELTRKDIVGEDVISVGFGITSSAAQNSGGVKRRGNLVASEVDDQFIYVNAEDNKNNSNVCSGDSGGPQYHIDEHGRVAQWGVHSFVFSLRQTSDPCLVSSGSTRTDAFREWILKQVERVHGEVDECAFARHYGDLVCDENCLTPDPDCIADVDGDGVVSAEELSDVDADDDGVITLEEAEDGTKSGCSHTGGAPLGLAAIGLALLGRRRRA